jgi:hypothetical protein
VFLTMTNMDPKDKGTYYCAQIRQWHSFRCHLHMNCGWASTLCLLCASGMCAGKVHCHVSIWGFLSTPGPHSFIFLLLLWFYITGTLRVVMYWASVFSFKATGWRVLGI